MKENRLIELLDEYDSVQYHKINHKIENGSIYRNVGGTDGWHEVWRYCKQFGFIQRLVEKDKIEWGKIKRNLERVHWYSDGTLNYTDGFTDTEILLMELSIQDNPISFLISILK